MSKLNPHIIHKEQYDTEKQELIAEFLRDWRWGKAFQFHLPNINKMCKCPEVWDYWNWFEKKWEQKLQEEQNNDEM